MSVSHVSHSAPKHVATTTPHSQGTAAKSPLHAPTPAGATSRTQLLPPARSAAAHVSKAAPVAAPKTTPALATSGMVGTKINTTA